jgi:hypothetical protein
LNFWIFSPPSVRPFRGQWPARFLLAVVGLTIAFAVILAGRRH